MIGGTALRLTLQLLLVVLGLLAGLGVFVLTLGLLFANQPADVAAVTLAISVMIQVLLVLAPWAAGRWWAGLRPVMAPFAIGAAVMAAVAITFWVATLLRAALG